MAGRAFAPQRGPRTHQEHLQPRVERHAQRGIGRCSAMVADRPARRRGDAASTSQSGQRATDHRSDGSPHGAAVADAGEQRAERVVVGQVLDGVQQQSGGRARDTGEQANDDHRTRVLHGAPCHGLNLSRAEGVPRFRRHTRMGPARSQAGPITCGCQSDEPLSDEPVSEDPSSLGESSAGVSPGVPTSTLTAPADWPPALLAFFARALVDSRLASAAAPAAALASARAA